MDMFEKNLREALREPQPRADLAGKVLARVEGSRKESRRPRFSFALLAAAAALAFAVVSLGLFQKTLMGTYATVENGGKHRISLGETVRSEDGAVVTLADGSRVEMRSHSELKLEKADDGVLVALNSGSIIVTAAKQIHGHLYVRTKDVTVSVVGTVFLVNAEETGSRVAVLQGEVQVWQGTKAQTLLPGQQVTTNPIMQSVPVSDELAWSRNAAAHQALLQQALALIQLPIVVPPPAAQTATVAKNVFEVVSIRAGDPNPERTGRGGGMPFGYGCGGSTLQVDGNRFVVTTNLFTLVSMAYGKQCVEIAKWGLISGGPSWVKSDQYTIQAILPEGSPAYTWRQLLEGYAPKLHAMIEAMLVDRFKLVVRRDAKEMPVYALTVAKGGPKLTPFQESTCDATSHLSPALIRGGPGITPLCFRGYNINPQRHFNLTANGATIDTFAQLLTGALDRPVINRTGITGVYDLHLESSKENTFAQNGRFQPDDDPPSVFTAIEEQLGLKLEPTKAPVEVLIIESAEKPSEN